MHAQLCIVIQVLLICTSLQQQLTSIKEESESRLQLIESCNLNIRRLSEEVKQKRAMLAQLKRELQQVVGTPDQLFELLELGSRVAELEWRLQEPEDQKLQLELEKKTAYQEVEAMQNFETLLHVLLGKME